MTPTAGRVGALSQKAAAAYCGVSVRLFRTVCPVKPVPLPGRGRKPVLRYLVAELDGWLLSCRNPKARGTRKAAA
jgi:hypothetical protein